MKWNTTILTRFVFAYLHLWSVGWRRWACFVHGDDPELIFPAFLQVPYFGLQLISRYLHRLLPIWFVTILLLDYVLLDRRTAVEIRSGPFQTYRLVVIVGYLRCSRFMRLVLKKQIIEIRLIITHGRNKFKIWKKVLFFSSYRTDFWRWFPARSPKVRNHLRRWPL